jgi:hypothetical protein
MLWARMVACVTGTVNQELLLRNEYLGAENRILRGQIKARLLFSEGEKATLAEIAPAARTESLGRIGGCRDAGYAAACGWRIVISLIQGHSSGLRGL